MEPNEEKAPGELRDSRVIHINRVAKVVKGGRRFSFTALVVIGDGAGRVGLGYGKAKEVPLAIQKGTEEAKRNLFRVAMAGSTVTHPVIGENGAGRVLLRPGRALAHGRHERRDGGRWRVWRRHRLRGPAATPRPLRGSPPHFLAARHELSEFFRCPATCCWGVVGVVWQ